MATSYLELTNRVLRRLNEVELTDMTFDNVRGIHATVKDAVAEAVERINKDQYKWPFNAVEHTQTLSIGVEEYGWPQDFKVVDWESFQIQKNEAFSIRTQRLTRWNREEWYRINRDSDYDSGLKGQSLPRYVSPSHGTGFAISPSPDKEYILKFRYFRHPPRLTLATDLPTIPSAYDYVIQAAALQVMYDFLEDLDKANYQEQQYNKGIDNMRGILINDYERVTDTRINF